MMKKFNKIFKSLVISSACISMLNVAVFADAVGTVKETIMVRSLPMGVGKIQGSLFPGDKVQVIDNNKGWYKVCKNGKVFGWASGQYINLKGTIVKTAANTQKTANTTAKKTTTIAKKPVTSKPAVKPAPKVAVKVQTPINKNVNVAYSAPKTGVVNISAGVYVRKTPDVAASILGTMSPHVGFYVLGQSNDWYKVKLADSTVGYIKSNYVAFASVKVSRGADYNTASNSTVVKAAVAPVATQQNSQAQVTTAQAETSAYESRVLYAKSFIGTPYVYGANGPSSFDCSGFTKYVFAHSGITLERVAADQARQGTFVAKSDLQPGDLVFFDTSGSNNGNICHVGMYIGGGQFIHASSGSVHSVTISSLSNGFYIGAYVTARRMN